jgi:hypothetical protein
MPLICENVSVTIQRQRNVGKKDQRTRAMQIGYLVKKAKGRYAEASFPGFTEDGAVTRERA